MTDRPSVRRHDALRKEDLSQLAARELRSAILGGAYATGDRLPSERELAEQFGVDRHTLRSAVHELELLGLITRRQGSGAHVLPYRETATLDLVPHLVTKPGTDELDPAVVDSIIDVERIMFAGMITLVVERGDDADFAAMHAAFADLESAVRKGSTLDVAATKLVLIRAMFRATHSIVCELFANTYQRMIHASIDPTGQLRARWAQRVASGAHELFGELIAAAERRDEPAAQRLLRTILDEMAAVQNDPTSSKSVASL